MAPYLIAQLVIFLLFVIGFLLFNLNADRRKVQRDDELSQLASSRGWGYSIPKDPAAGFQLSGKASAKFPWQLEVCCGEEGGHASGRSVSGNPASGSLPSNYRIVIEPNH